MALVQRTRDAKYIPSDAKILKTTEDGWIHYEMYTGLVLSTRERNYYDDSDFYIVVWDHEQGKPKEVNTWTTRYPSDHIVKEERDATDDIEKLYGEYLAAERAKEEAAEARREAMRLSKGKDVVVVKGRKVAKGTEGRIFWLGDNGWGLSAGLELLNGDRVFTAASNIQVKL
jgi:hypothetical protein